MTKESINLENEQNIEYIGRIRSNYASLSKTQKKIAKYIMEHQAEVVHYSVTQLAAKTGTVPSTITRFCQALSFRGFSELKVYIEKGLISPMAERDNIQKDDALSVVIQKLMNTSRDVVADTQRIINPETVSSVADALLEAGTICIFGQSGGHISALQAQQMLLRVGILCQTSNDPLDMSITACTLKSKDVVIGIAYSGEARSVIQAMDSARKKGATVVAVTAAPNSTMSKIANHTLYYSHNIPDDLQYLHLGSMCEIAIFGVLQAEILRKTNREDVIDECKKAILNNRLK